MLQFGRYLIYSESPLFLFLFSISLEQQQYECIAWTKNFVYLLTIRYFPSKDVKNEVFPQSTSDSFSIDFIDTGIP